MQKCISPRNRAPLLDWIECWCFLNGGVSVMNWVRGLLVIDDWWEIVSLDTWTMVVLVNYCIFEQLNHFYITFDINVNGGESDMKKIQLGRKKNMMKMYIWYSWNLDIFHLCFHQCQRGRLLAWMLVLWGSIVEHWYDVFIIVFVIDDNIVISL